jgi:hypothetical protein
VFAQQRLGDYQIMLKSLVITADPFRQCLPIADRRTNGREIPGGVVRITKTQALLIVLWLGVGVAYVLSLSLGPSNPHLPYGVVAGAIAFLFAYILIWRRITRDRRRLIADLGAWLRAHAPHKPDDDSGAPGPDRGTARPSP